MQKQSKGLSPSSFSVKLPLIASKVSFVVYFMVSPRIYNIFPAEREVEVSLFVFY